MKNIMDYDLEAEFEDEFDVLNDLEADDQDLYGLPKSKKSLDFTTPSSRHAKNKTYKVSLNDSFPMPLEGKGDEEDQFVKQNGDGCTQDGQASVKKRKQDEMFGEMSDDEDTQGQTEDALPDIVHRSKRARTQPSDAAAIANHLPSFEVSPPPSPDIPDVLCFESSKPQRLQPEPDEDSGSQKSTEEALERCRVFRRMPETDFISATGEDGTRVYLALKDDYDLQMEEKSFVEGQRSLQLLNIPLAVLRVQMEEEQTRKLVEESQRITSMLRGSDGDEREEDTENKGTAEHQLWVDKYTPRRYTDLLSDEATNRVLLRWLRQWDHVVFGKELPRTDPVKQHKKKEQNKDFKFKRNTPEVSEDLDQHNRPLQKVALLCGAPGLGKTTLAHVIARHAGYTVVEMNASDDRSLEVFKNKVESATQMKAVLGADPRPNCLVIDEIDGAQQAAINALLSVIKEADGNKKKKKEGNLLLRPIICICNEPYVPALRQLRQVALVISFNQTEATRLASRLMEISRGEHLKTDTTALLALCEKADNDIRSCLNTLQFVQRRSKQFTLHNVHSMSTGQKDAHKNIFSVWHGIFQMPKQKRKRYVNPYDRGNPDAVAAVAQDGMVHQNNTSLAARFTNVLQMALAAGEMEKVMQGLQENYPLAKIKDPRLEAVNIANEWLCFVDIINKEVAHSQNYTYWKYIPYLAVTFHLLFASNSYLKIAFPHSQYENNLKRSKTGNLVTSLLMDMAPSVRRNLDLLVTATEVLPPLLEIIQPTLRPVNTQLYSAREKEGLAQLIRVMIAYNLTYNQERSPEGTYNYVLDPHVDEVVRFPSIKASKQLTYGAKQLIAREIELERMRRTELAMGNRSDGDTEVAATSTKSFTAQTGGRGKCEQPEGSVPNYKRQTLQPKQITEEEKPVLDFFGRVIKKVSPQVKGEKAAQRDKIASDIWFRFEEGYTNAVRKTVRIQDLL